MGSNKPEHVEYRYSVQEYIHTINGTPFPELRLHTKWERYAQCVYKHFDLWKAPGEPPVDNKGLIDMELDFVGSQRDQRDQQTAF